MLSLLVQAVSPIATEDIQFLCTTLSSSWSSGRCLPCFQTWDSSADGPKILLWLAKPSHPVSNRAWHFTQPA